MMFTFGFISGVAATLLFLVVYALMSTAKKADEDMERAYRQLQDCERNGRGLGG